MPEPIAAGYALAQLAPGVLDSLTEAELIWAVHSYDLWLRPEQRLPSGDWRSFGMIAGRGWGKTFGYGPWINHQVESGACLSPALMAPNEERCIEVQVKAIVESSPPWFKAEPYRDAVRWPNGVVAEAFTPEAPGRSRSGNFDLTWLTEIVDWQESTRLEAFQNIVTATRVRGAQIIWDTTSKGQNEVIQALLEAHQEDPAANILRRGTSFDNPMLSRQYLQALMRNYRPVGSRRYLEEVEGQIFSESAGALWEREWITANRVSANTIDPKLTLIGLDPALSARSDADETGLVVASRDSQYDVYITRDMSGHYTPEQWGSIVVDECVRGAAGLIVERNHAGDMPETIIRAAAKEKGLEVRVIADDGKPFPSRTRGVIYLRGTTSTRSKESRAGGPATLYSQGKVHHVGVFDRLEKELTTWEPGTCKSPNRLDALAFVVGELAELKREGRRRNADAEVKAAADAQARLRAIVSVGGRGRLGR